MEPYSPFIAHPLPPMPVAEPPLPVADPSLPASLLNQINYYFRYLNIVSLSLWMFIPYESIYTSFKAFCEVNC